MSGRRSVAALAVAFLAACTPRPVVVERTATPAVIVVPTELANGRIEIVLRPTYLLSTPTRVDIAIVARRGSIIGPMEARVMASGINEGGSPAEVLVRRLAGNAVTASAGQRATTFVTWDGTDQFRMRVPADAYVLLLEFESNDGGSTRTVRATATLQMND